MNSLSTSTAEGLASVTSSVGSLSTGLGAVASRRDSFGKGAAAALGGGSTYDATTGEVSAPSYTVYGAKGYASTVQSVGQAIDSINSGGIKYFHANSTEADGEATGTNSIAIGPKAVADADNSVAIGFGAVTSQDKAPDSPTAAGNVAFASFAGINPVGVVSVGARNAERKIIHVAAGNLSQVSTDAVNGSQLFATNSAVTSLSTALSIASTDLSRLHTSTSAAISSLSTSTSTVASSLSNGHVAAGDALASLSTSQADLGTRLNQLSSKIDSSAADASKATGAASDMKGDGSRRPTVSDGSNSVALGANSTNSHRDNVVSVGDAGRERQVINVAPGTEGTDAVNVNQLQSLSTTVEQSLSTQQLQINSLGAQVQQVQQQIQQTDQMARQGIAAVGAMASIPQLDQNSNFGMGMGASTFGGQQAIAINMQARISQNLKVALNTGISGSQKVVGAGMLYQW
ncbi:YadA family autotransporter adhesin [Burkholderia cepacia]|uniref:YadA family autotransporter adhesin n=1 Tax=Burkholderia cepacia TaxID=292 RepID=UPI002ED92D89